MYDFDQVAILRDWYFVTPFDYSTTKEDFSDQFIEPALEFTRMDQETSDTIHATIDLTLEADDDCQIDVGEILPLYLAGIVEQTDYTPFRPYKTAR